MIRLNLDLDIRHSFTKKTFVKSNLALFDIISMGGVTSYEIEKTTKLINLHKTKLDKRTTSLKRTLKNVISVRYENKVDFDYFRKFAGKRKLDFGNAIKKITKREYFSSTYLEIKIIEKEILNIKREIIYTDENIKM